MFDLPEKITIWTKTTDAFGRIVWSVPSVHNARIAYRQQKITDINGDQVVSDANCYSDTDLLTPGDVATLRNTWIYFGESGAVEPPESANDIKAVSHTPSGVNLKKVWF